MATLQQCDIRSLLQSKLDKAVLRLDKLTQVPALARGEVVKLDASELLRRKAQQKRIRKATKAVEVAQKNLDLYIMSSPSPSTPSRPPRPSVGIGMTPEQQRDYSSTMVTLQQQNLRSIENMFQSAQREAAVGRFETTNSINAAYGLPVISSVEIRQQVAENRAAGPPPPPQQRQVQPQQRQLVQPPAQEGFSANVRNVGYLKTAAARVSLTTDTSGSLLANQQSDGEKNFQRRRMIFPSKGSYRSRRSSVNVAVANNVLGRSDKLNHQRSLAPTGDGNATQQELPLSKLFERGHNKGELVWHVKKKVH